MNTNAETADRYELLLVDQADPIVRLHGERAARPPDYRLKLALKTLLRQFGLRCVAVRDAGQGGGFQEDQVPPGVSHAA